MTLSIVSRLGTNLSLGGATRDVGSRRATSGSEPLRMSALQDFHRGTNDMARSLSALRDSLLDAKSSSGRGPVITSDKLVKVVTHTHTVEHEATQTTLTSGEAVTGTGRGFNSPRLFWDGDSTSRVRVRGPYTGTEDDKLTFEVGEDADGQHISVTNQAGEDLGSYDVESGKHNRLRLDNGIEIRIQRGSIETGDSFSLEVHGQEDPTVLDRRLRGGRNNRMAFADGDQVRRGSFEINGESIRVNRQDTVESMLRKITRSRAGVVASYDEDTDKVTLTQKEAGANDITLGDDTSGFLAAMNLEDGERTMGQDARVETIERKEVVTDVELKRGDFFINDKVILVRPGDSLRDVVTRINGSDAGVKARLSRGTGELVMHSEDKKAPITLRDGTSGFFEATGIREGTYKAKSGGMSSSAVREVMDQLRGVGDSSAALFGAVSGEKHAGGQLGTMRGQLSKVMERSLSDARPDARKAAEQVFGKEGGEDFFALLAGEASDLKSGLRSGDEDLMKFLLGEEKDGSGGLLHGMLSELSDMGVALGREHGASGLVIDIKV